MEGFHKGGYPKGKCNWSGWFGSNYPYFRKPPNINLYKYTHRKREREKSIFPTSSSTWRILYLLFKRVASQECVLSGMNTKIQRFNRKSNTTSSSVTTSEARKHLQIICPCSPHLLNSSKTMCFIIFLTTSNRLVIKCGKSPSNCL